MASWQSELIKFIFQQQSRKMERLNLKYWNEHTSVRPFVNTAKTGQRKPSY